MKLTLGFSPCPNDTFIFDALVNRKIETGGLSFEAVLEDVETLNQWALEGKLDITKLSFPALFRSLPQYRLLQAGSALGKGVGPLLVGRKGELPAPDQLSALPVAIPGVHTTANLLMGFAFPEVTHKIPFLFSDIEAAVATGKTDLGVIIHENRFTYAEKGLEQLADLGAIWEERMQVPVPLGGIAVHQRISRETAVTVTALIRRSLTYAWAAYPQVTGYVKDHAQAMSEQVMRNHIELYVNDFSMDLGTEGQKAIQTLYKVYHGHEPFNHGNPPELFL